MKRLMICFLVLFVFAVSAYAETAGEKGHEAMKEEGQQMKMMCPKMPQMQEHGMMRGGQQMPMIGQMMGHGMMMHDMMQMMSEILDMQEKIVGGVKASEKKELLIKIKDMKSKMQQSMSMCKCMIGGMMGGMMGGMTGQAPCPSAPKEPEGKEKEKTEQHVH
jgi:hypothetical protein